MSVSEDLALSPEHQQPELFGSVKEAVPPLAALKFIGAIGEGHVVAKQQDHSLAAEMFVRRATWACTLLMARPTSQVFRFAFWLQERA